MNRVLDTSYQSTRGDALGDGESSLPVVDASVVLTTPSGQPTKQAGSADWFTSLVQTVTPALANVYQARELNKLNISRTNAGLPPITGAQFANQYQPPSANVSVGPSAQLTKLLMFGGLGVGAFLVFRTLMKR